VLELEGGGRCPVLIGAGAADPCIAPRLVPVAEAMVGLVLVDTYLAQRAQAP
jgi:chorismate synthase